MSTIDAVIAQARREGGFSERRRFSVAKTQAIQKLRKFALADPYAYMLELIQSAIANGARFLDIALDQGSMTLSYIGGGIPGDALARLFDFLFAAKDRADLGYLRELALGVNALLLFAPERVVIESGDGTREGTTRVELLAGGEKFDVGRPDHALAGTFIRAEGMDRARVMRELKLQGEPNRMYELPIIESRCLAAPIPIIFNGEALFGHSARRIPGLFGFERVLAVDEGDLYGAIGVPRSGGPAEFHLLTRGVLIETVEQVLVEGRRIGGILCFDALRKTADHARIVRDDRLEELWLRLRPHARALLSDDAPEPTRAAQVFRGEVLDTAALRAYLRETRRVVTMPPTIAEDSPQARVAQQIAASLDAGLLLVAPEQVWALRILGGAGVRVFEPALGVRAEVEFYTQAPAEPPARPWLIQPIEAPPLTLAATLDALVAGADPDDPELAQRRAEFSAVLGDSGEITATVYTPAAADGDATLTVELRMCERLLLRAEVPSSRSGHVVVAALPDRSYAALRATAHAGERSLAERLAAVVAQHAAGALAEAGRRALESLAGETCEPGSAAARLALAAVVRAAVVRLRGGDSPGADLVLLEPGPSGLDLLGLPLLRTVTGEPLGLRALMQRTRERTHGLVYGVIREVAPDLDGLDAGLVLDLDAASERLLIALLGEAMYVRVDAREDCARYEGVRCRDLALGLRDHPAFPLLVEGDDPSTWPEGQQRACLDALLEQLLARVAEDGADEGRAELRRHALRHLQWFALHAPESHLDLLGHVQMARSIAGGTHSAEAVLAAMAHQRPLHAYAWHGPLPAADAPAQKGPRDLELTPFVYQQLLALGPVASAFDFEPEDAEAAARGEAATRYLAAAQVSGPGVEGVIGVPAAALAVPTVLVYDGERRRRVHVFGELARGLGVVGVLRVARPAFGEAEAREVGGEIFRAASVVYTKLVALVAARPADDPAASRALAVMLAHAGRHLQLTADASGRVRALFTSPAAEQVLAQPLFPGPHGLPRSGLRVIQRFCEAVARGDADPRAALGLDALPPVLRRWCEASLDPRRISRPAARPAPRAQATSEPLAGERLAAALQGWLHALAPDHEDSEERRGSVALLGGELGMRIHGLGTVVGNALSWHLMLAEQHPLVQRVHAGGPGQPAALAWLLLACYGLINAAFPKITAAHEIEFQRRVVEALLRGDFGVLAAPDPPPADAG